MSSLSSSPSPSRWQARFLEHGLAPFILFTMAVILFIVMVAGDVRGEGHNTEPITISERVEWDNRSISLNRDIIILDSGELLIRETTLIPDSVTTVRFINVSQGGSLEIYRSQIGELNRSLLIQGAGRMIADENVFGGVGFILRDTQSSITDNQFIGYPPLRPSPLNSYVIKIENASPEIRGNSFSDQLGVILLNNSSSVIADNRIEWFRFWAIVAENSEILIQGNRIGIDPSPLHNNHWGAIYGVKSRLLVKNNSIYDLPSGHGILSDNAVIVNSSFTDVQIVIYGRDITSINTTIQNEYFQSKKIGRIILTGGTNEFTNTSFFEDRTWLWLNASLKVKNFLHVLVLNQDGQPVESAQVQIFDSGNRKVFEGFTDGRGRIPSQSLTIYQAESQYQSLNNITKDYSTPYRIRVSSFGYSIETMVYLNKTTHQTIYLELLPDLVPSLALSHQSGLVNKPIKITIKVDNLGYKSASEIDIDIYDGNTLINSNIVEYLDAGESDMQTFLWTPAIPGSHALRVVVDDDNLIKESREDNNEAVKTISITAISTKVPSFVLPPSMLIISIIIYTWMSYWKMGVFHE